MSERLILWFWHILHFAASGYLTSRDYQKRIYEYAP